LLFRVGLPGAEDPSLVTSWDRVTRAFGASAPGGACEKSSLPRPSPRVSSTRRPGSSEKATGPPTATASWWRSRAPAASALASRRVAIRSAWAH